MKEWTANAFARSFHHSDVNLSPHILVAQSLDDGTAELERAGGREFNSSLTQDGFSLFLSF